MNIGEKREKRNRRKKKKSKQPKEERIMWHCVRAFAHLHGWMVVLAKFRIHQWFYGNGAIVNKRLNSINEMVKCARRTSTTINVCAVRFIKSTSSDWLIARHFPSLCHFPFYFSRSILRCVYYYLNGSSFKVQRNFFTFAAFAAHFICHWNLFAIRFECIVSIFSRATKWCSLLFCVGAEGGGLWVWVANWWTHKIVVVQWKMIRLWWMCKRLIKKKKRRTAQAIQRQAVKTGDLPVHFTKQVGRIFACRWKSLFNRLIASHCKCRSLLIDINPDCTQFIIGELCDLFSFHFGVCVDGVAADAAAFSFLFRIRLLNSRFLLFFSIVASYRALVSSISLSLVLMVFFVSYFCFFHTHFVFTSFHGLRLKLLKSIYSARMINCDISATRRCFSNNIIIYIFFFRWLSFVSPPPQKYGQIESSFWGRMNPSWLPQKERNLAKFLTKAKYEDDSKKKTTSKNIRVCVCVCKHTHSHSVYRSRTSSRNIAVDLNWKRNKTLILLQFTIYLSSHALSNCFDVARRSPFFLRYVVRGGLFAGRNRNTDT